MASTLAGPRPISAPRVGMHKRRTLGRVYRIFPVIRDKSYSPHD
jgi:hypothetical protein